MINFKGTVEHQQKLFTCTQSRQKQCQSRRLGGVTSSQIKTSWGHTEIDQLLKQCLLLQQIATDCFVRTYQQLDS